MMKYASLTFPWAGLVRNSVSSVPLTEPRTNGDPRGCSPRGDENVAARVATPSASASAVADGGELLRQPAAERRHVCQEA